MARRLWPAAQRDVSFTSLSGSPVRPLYTAADAPGDPGFPGVFPFTRPWKALSRSSVSTPAAWPRPPSTRSRSAPRRGRAPRWRPGRRTGSRWRCGRAARLGVAGLGRTRGDRRVGLEDQAVVGLRVAGLGHDRAHLGDRLAHVGLDLRHLGVDLRLLRLGSHGPVLAT